MAIDTLLSHDDRRGITNAPQSIGCGFGPPEIFPVTIGERLDCVFAKCVQLTPLGGTEWVCAVDVERSRWVVLAEAFVHLSGKGRGKMGRACRWIGRRGAIDTVQANAFCVLSFGHLREGRERTGVFQCSVEYDLFGTILLNDHGVKRHCQ